MVPAVFGPWADRLLFTAAVRPNEHVLDVATGTGIVARRAARRVGVGGRVVGLDASADMLATARRAAEREGLCVEWHAGLAERLPFPDQSFDLVLCQAALMFFADRLAALRQMHRVLREGGRVAISVPQGITRHRFYAQLHDEIQERCGVSSVQEIFALGEAGQIQTLLEQAGFERLVVEPASIISRFPDPEAFLAGEIDVDTAAIPSMQHLDAEARHRLLARIREAMDGPLREVTQDGHVVMTFHLNLALATR